MEKRKATVNVISCVACGVCRLQCPRNAISIYRGCYAAVDENLCVGCGVCEKACPASAINVKVKDVING